MRLGGFRIFDAIGVASGEGVFVLDGVGSQMLAYEQLEGSTGRRIKYRAPRYEARRLFPGRAPRVRVSSSEFRLHDISLGGLAAISKRSHDEIPAIGETVTVSIQQSGLSIFEAKAKICRTENTVFGAKIAFSLVDRVVEFDKLLTRNAQAQMAARSPQLLPESAQLVPRDYRAFCADVVRLLRAYQTTLQVNSTAAEAFEGGLNNVDAFEACEPGLIQQWRALWRTGNELADPIGKDREVREATKEFTELVLTPELCHGSIWHRSYHKPLGYPGDFQVMNQVYDWERRGDTAYEMLLHRVGLEVAECIGTRMEVVRAQIAKIVAEKNGERPARITSLGSGPAREVQTFLQDLARPGARAEFTLIDQEQEALQYAHQRTFPFVLNSEGRVRVDGLNISFTDILRGGQALSELPGQDLVYSVGLLDYLADHRAKALVRRLFDLLQPGGLLIIGNMNKCAMSNYWPMEYIVDWTLEYRDDAEMIAWTEGLNVAQAWTETERTGRVRLLFVRKS